MSGTRQGSACWDRSRPTAAAPVAGQQLPFPGGLTFESQPARLDGRCTKRDRRQEDDEGGESLGEEGKGKGEGRTINLVPGPCAYGVGRQGSPGDNLSPWISVQMAGQGTPEDPPLIDLGGKTENLALLWAPASNQLYRTRPAWLLVSSFPFFFLFSSSSQVICADPRGSEQGDVRGSRGARGEI